jgi:hypothetical protein
MLEIGDLHIAESPMYDDHTVERLNRAKVEEDEPHLNQVQKDLYVDLMSTVIDARWKIIVQNETASMNLVQ